MTNPIPVGGQSQWFNGIPTVVGRSRAGVWKLINPDADTIKAIRAANKDCTVVVRRFTGQARYNVEPDPFTYGVEYARALRAMIGVGWYKDIVVEFENEPAVWNGSDASKLNESGKGFAQECTVLGMKPAFPNFSEGHPEVYSGGYNLYPDLIAALAPALREVKAAGGFYARHEYGWPSMKDGYDERLGLGFRCGRHKADLAVLPADLRDIPVLITECGKDALIVGEVGGLYHRGGTMDAMIAEMDWYRSICAPNVKGLLFFGYQLYGGGSASSPQALSYPAAGVMVTKIDNARSRYGFNTIRTMAVDWSEYDAARDGLDKAKFDEALSRWSAAPVVPPAPLAEGLRPGDNPMFEFAFLTAAWAASKIDFNPDAAFFKFAQSKGLGRPVTNEFPFTYNGVDYWAQGYERGVVLAKAGEWVNVVARDWLTGKLLDAVAPPPPPPPGTLPTPYKFPSILTAIGALGQEGLPQQGKPFYRLMGATVLQSVSATLTVTVLGKTGAPQIGVKAVNLFPDGNGEVIDTDGNGNAHFNFGSSSAFSVPGKGPFTVFVGDETSYKDVEFKVVHGTSVSDVVKSLGDWQGEHTDIKLQFQEQ